MVRAARTGAAVMLSLAVLVAASGWLYAARPLGPLRGPSVHDGLALDELSHRASVPLLVYGGHNWALWRANARVAYLAAARRLEHG